MESYFELGPASEVATAWFLSWNGMDWMAMVFRDDAAAPWRAVWRFRYVMDNKDPWESDDLKSGYRIVLKPDEESRESLVSIFGDIAEKLKDKAHGRLWRVDIDGSADAFCSAWSRLPFTHARVPSPEPSQVQ